MKSDYTSFFILSSMSLILIAFFAHVESFMDFPRGEKEQERVSGLKHACPTKTMLQGSLDLFFDEASEVISPIKYEALKKSELECIPREIMVTLPKQKTGGVEFIQDDHRRKQMRMIRASIASVFSKAKISFTYE